MIYTILTEDGLFGVNREFRQIDLSEVPSDIASIQFDTERNTGVIQWRSDVFDSTSVRDFETERRAEQAARANNKSLADLEPVYKSVQIRRPRRVISSFTQFEPLIARWEAAAPVPLPPNEPGPVENRVPLVEVVKLLVRKGVLSLEDVEHLRSTVKE